MTGTIKKENQRYLKQLSSTDQRRLTLNYNAKTSVVHTNGKSQLNVFLEDLSQTFPYFFKGYQNFQIHPFLVTL